MLWSPLQRLKAVTVVGVGLQWHLVVRCFSCGHSPHAAAGKSSRSSRVLVPTFPAASDPGGRGCLLLPHHPCIQSWAMYAYMLFPRALRLVYPPDLWQYPISLHIQDLAALGINNHTCNMTTVFIAAVGMCWGFKYNSVLWGKLAKSGSEACHRQRDGKALLLISVELLILYIQSNYCKSLFTLCWFYLSLFYFVLCADLQLLHKII